MLHVIAMNRPSCFAAMCSQYPDANVADYNQRLPEFYLSHRDMPRDDQALVMARVARKTLISFEEHGQQYAVAFDERQLMEGVRCFQLPVDVCSSLMSKIAGLEQVMPNSMHRYGKILLPHMQRDIYSLVACVLPADDVARVNHIHAFYVQYSDAVGQKSLDSHIDDSHWYPRPPPQCFLIKFIRPPPGPSTCAFLCRLTCAAASLCLTRKTSPTGTRKPDAASSIEVACVTTCCRWSAVIARTSLCGSASPLALQQSSSDDVSCMSAR